MSHEEVGIPEVEDHNTALSYRQGESSEEFPIGVLAVIPEALGHHDREIKGPLLERMPENVRVHVRRSAPKPSCYIDGNCVTLDTRDFVAYSGQLARMASHATADIGGSSDSRQGCLTADELHLFISSFRRNIRVNILEPSCGVKISGHRHAAIVKGRVCSSRLWLLGR